MAMLLLSLMVILASVEGYNRPFTAFHRGQVEAVHGPRPSGGYAFQRVHPTYRRLQARPGHFQRKVYNFQQPALYQFGRNSAFSKFFSGNVVEQTRAQADSTKAVLTSLASNPRAAKYIERAIDVSKCLESVEDAIDGIEGAAKLVEKNGPEILKLVETVESLENEKDVTKLVKAAANILRILDDLIPNLAAKSSKQCDASPADTIEAFKELAGLVGDISNARDLQLSYSTRQQLTLSSKILSEVTSFLGKINKSLSSFGELCNKDKDYNINVINAIGDIMESMAVLFDNLGSVDRAKEIKSKGEFVKKAVDAFSDLDIDSTLECGTAGSLKALAQTLDDLSQIVEDIGIEKLTKELGIDLEFINSF
eukprot:TRINITY_DN4686_c0_g1_i5.p1 TRINITY_DN4686_c0_g1~~TRINITY_DN4686_c0_g1_i5.p1  ORF type:complete len:367 (-),score=107.45 TRINITY_DN4686_c0_g1_i5:195-1295(-)